MSASVSSSKGLDSQSMVGLTGTVQDSDFQGQSTSLRRRKMKKAFGIGGGIAAAALLIAIGVTLFFKLSPPKVVTAVVSPVSLPQVKFAVAGESAQYESLTANVNRVSAIVVSNGLEHLRPQLVLATDLAQFWAKLHQVEMPSRAPPPIVAPQPGKKGASAKTSKKEKAARKKAEKEGQTFFPNDIKAFTTPADVTFQQVVHWQLLDKSILQAIYSLLGEVDFVANLETSQVKTKDDAESIKSSLASFKTKFLATLDNVSSFLKSEMEQCSASPATAPNHPNTKLIEGDMATLDDLRMLFTQRMFNMHSLLGKKHSKFADVFMVPQTMEAAIDGPQLDALKAKAFSPTYLPPLLSRAYLSVSLLESQLSPPETVVKST